MTNGSDSNSANSATSAVEADDRADTKVVDGTEAAYGAEQDDAEGTGDGRSLRRKRNRDAVITALIDLIREGDLNPTVAKIADRALVSHRSVFRYFTDLNDLAKTAIDTEMVKAWPLSVITNPGEGTLDERIDVLVQTSMRTFERTHRLGLVGRAKSIVLEELNEGMVNIYELRLDQVRRQFAPELDQMDPDRAEAIAVAVTAATGLDSYDVQHRMRGLPPEQIAEMWKVTIDALLD